VCCTIQNLHNSKEKNNKNNYESSGENDGGTGRNFRPVSGEHY